MKIRSRLERLETKVGALQGSRMVVVPIAYGESPGDALGAAGFTPEPADLVVLVTRYGGVPFVRTPNISTLPSRK
jgi:hypothetical protein